MRLTRFIASVSICMLIAVFVFTSVARAEVVTATGKGKTPEAAVQDALKKAVEAAIAQLVDDDTFKKNKAKILGAIKGKNYVRKHKQEGEEEFTGSAYIVTVKAEVDTQALEKDINTLGLLQDAMGNPRIMVLYNAKLPMGGQLQRADADYGLGAFFDNSYGSIVDVLTEKGFDVVDKGASEKFSVQLADTHEVDVDLNKASAYGLKYHADLILYYQAIGIGSESGGAKIFLRSELINPTTARIIASKKVEHTSGTGNIAESLYRAADEVGRKIATTMVEAIKKNWKREKSSGGTFILVMDGVDDTEEVIGFRNQLKKYPEFEKIREVESGGGKTTYEVKYTGGRDDLDNLVIKAAKELGWKVKRIRAEGNRSTWKKQ